MNIWACDYHAIFFTFTFGGLFTCEVILEERYHASASGQGVFRKREDDWEPLKGFHFHSYLKSQQRILL